jgi:hypothetical protein
LNLILSQKFKKPLKSGSSHVQNMQTALQKISAHSKVFAKTLQPKKFAIYFFIARRGQNCWSWQLLLRRWGGYGLTEVHISFKFHKKCNIPLFLILSHQSLLQKAQKPSIFGGFLVGKEWKQNDWCKCDLSII